MFKDVVSDDGVAPGAALTAVTILDAVIAIRHGTQVPVPGVDVAQMLEPTGTEQGYALIVLRHDGCREAHVVAGLSARHLPDAAANVEHVARDRWEAADKVRGSDHRRVEVAAEAEICVLVNMPMLVIEEIREMSETINVAVNNGCIRSAGDNDTQTSGVEVFIAEPLRDKGGGGCGWSRSRHGERW